MPEAWKNYFTNIDEDPASIAFDFQFGKTAPLKAYPYLLLVSIGLRTPREDGLSAQAEFDVLCKIDDSLGEHLAKTCNGIYVGRVTANARREFCFYARSDKSFEETVQQVRREFPLYSFEARSVVDKEWRHYFDYLYPSREELQSMKNMDVLDALTNHGDTLMEARDVDHWIYFRRIEDRLNYIRDVEALGYRIVAQTTLESRDRPFSLQVCRIQMLTPDAIDDAVLELFRLAEELDAEYDGWGTLVVSTKN